MKILTQRNNKRPVCLSVPFVNERGKHGKFSVVGSISATKKSLWRLNNYAVARAIGDGVAQGNLDAEFNQYYNVIARNNVILGAR